MHTEADTIAALATPVGTAALGVIRVSGPLSRALAETCLGLTNWTPRQARFGRYCNLKGEALDQVVGIFYEGPASYTGEDALELSCHGNPYLLQAILADMLARGCRSADPGEFTRRAFVNGKLDLTQAEAVVDVIHARGERALRAAQRQLDGGLRRHLEPLIDNLLGVIARVEAYIDFPDEDLPPEDKRFVDSALAELERQIGRLLATERYGTLLRDGIRTVIVGEPNAGKSSLLNRLVGRERALVSAEPGTTRDFIEERILLGGHCLRLIDTAGLNTSPAPLEALGIAKTLERAAEADLFLLVLDATRPAPSLPPEVTSRSTPENTVVVWNKSDLCASVTQVSGYKQIVSISALTGEGLPDLESAVVTCADRFRTELGEEEIAINARHADALDRARLALGEARRGLAIAGPVELMASELRMTLDALGEISGKVDNERMLDHLFATFCIGK